MQNHATTRTVTINSTPTTIHEYQGQPVITFAQIDELHNRPAGTASRNFNRNKKRFVSGKHYFFLKKQEINEIRIFTNAPKRGITLLTERGYLLLAKSLNDRLAWQIQEKLIDHYFNRRVAPNPKVIPLPRPAFDPAAKLTALQSTTPTKKDEPKYSGQIVAALYLSATARSGGDPNGAILSSILHSLDARKGYRAGFAAVIAEAIHGCAGVRT